MKEAKEWYAEYCADRKLPASQRKLGASNGDLIRAIQLDAWKQGMTDAKQIVENHPFADKFPTDEDDITRRDLDIARAILTARDSKTTL